MPVRWTAAAVTWKFPTRTPGHRPATTSRSSACASPPFRSARAPRSPRRMSSSRWIETKGNTQVVNVIIEGQLSANAPAFSTAAKDITNRTPTKAQVKWTIPTGLANDTKFQSPDISSILNEIMSQAGWASGNAIVITIRDDKSSPSAGRALRRSGRGRVDGGPPAAHRDVRPLRVGSRSGGRRHGQSPWRCWAGPRAMGPSCTTSTSARRRT